MAFPREDIRDGKVAGHVGAVSSQPRYLRGDPVPYYLVAGSCHHQLHELIEVENELDARIVLRSLALLRVRK